MSFSLDAVSLAGATVGTTDTVSWANLAQSVGYGIPEAGPPHLALLNESPCGLQLQFGTGEQMALPAGGWQTITLNPTCTNFAYQVLYVLNASPIVASLLGTWYGPGEPVPDAPILGNSPIGGSVTSGIAQFLEGVGQSQTITEIDSANGGPALAPGSGTSTDLVLSALNNLGNVVDMVVLNAVANTITTPSSPQFLLNAAETITRTLSGSIKALLNLNSTDANNYSLALDTDSTFVIRDATAAKNVLKVGPNKGFAQIGDQVTAGSYGAAPIVAQAINTNVTSLATQNILAYSATASTTYRVNVALTPQNTSPRVLAVVCQWTDPNTNTANAEFFIGINGSTIQAFNTTNTWPTGAGVAYSTMPKTIRAKTGTNITVTYQDTTGTPNDFVTAIIERLS